MVRKQLGVAPINPTDAATKTYVDPQITSTVSAAGTTTLVYTSALVQMITGATTQIVALPTTSVFAGQQWLIMNQSTGVVTVNASGGATVIILAPGTSVLVIAAQATPTLATHWDTQYNGALVTSGKSLQIANSLSIAAFDGSTYNFGGTPTVLTSPVLSIGTTQTMVASYSIPANTLVAGMAFQLEAFGVQTLSNTPTWFICLGTGNNTSDPVISSVGAAQTASAGGVNFEGLLTVRTIGSSGTCIASGVAVGSVSVVATTATTTTINTTVQNYLTLQCKTGTSTHNVHQAFISVCQV